MDRVPYRRVTPSRNGSPGEYTSHHEAVEREEAISRGETLIMQCIFSGILLVVVLVASMTSIGPAVALRGGIRQVLTGAETFEELIADVRSFGAEWFGWEEVSAPPIIDFTYPAQEHYDYPTWEHEYSELEPLAGEVHNEETTMADDVSNPTVPEPSGTPGLWD